VESQAIPIRNKREWVMQFHSQIFQMDPAALACFSAKAADTGSRDWKELNVDLYVVVDQVSGLVKIGVSRDTRSRKPGVGFIRDLSKSYIVKGLDAFDARKIEASIKRRFSAHTLLNGPGWTETFSGGTYEDIGRHIDSLRPFVGLGAVVSLSGEVQPDIPGLLGATPAATLVHNPAAALLTSTEIVWAAGYSGYYQGVICSNVVRRLRMFCDRNVELGDPVRADVWRFPVRAVSAWWLSEGRSYVAREIAKREKARPTP
jgi:hypothetical protein